MALYGGCTCVLLLRQKLELFCDSAGAPAAFSSLYS